MDWPKTPGRDSRRSSAFDISWPYRDHHMMDFLAHATGNAIVDEHALSAELAAKRRRRGHLRVRLGLAHSEAGDVEQRYAV
ncbi:MAG: hypothetical protein K2Y33_00660, partial [Mycolicibacterium frederiksbergense]|nr:hypothetical protein [Mycolicibacterium frederiksbergense]